MIKCYLCNNEFNAKQIIKHETECLDKWKQMSSEEKRRAIEEQKEWLNLDDHNNQTGQWKKFKAILEICSKCGRNFFEHRLAKHELNCKGRQQMSPFDKSNEHQTNESIDYSNDVREKLGESIIFVRKTKPLNRSTLTYKQMNIPIAHTNQRIESNEQVELSNTIDKSINRHQLTSNKLNNWYSKCAQCGKVLNRLNTKTHLQFHARSNASISTQLSEDNLKLNNFDKNNDYNEESINAPSNQLSSSFHNRPTVVLDDRLINTNQQRRTIQNYPSNDDHSKTELILQIDQQFNPSTDNPINQSIAINQSKTSTSFIQQPHDFSSNLIEDFIVRQPINGQLMFNEQEWDEHLKQLKKCTKCNRTFFANRIKKHQNTCKAQPI